MHTIPIIETQRLILRAHELKDYEGSVAMWSDPLITRYTIGSPSTDQRTWIRILAHRGHWSLMGFGYWAVADKTTNQYLGDIGFADFKRQIHPSIDGIPELGWALIQKVHGQGFATEALKAAIDWGDQNLESDRTVCIIHPDNHASLKVAAKCGYKEYARTLKDDEPTILFERASRRK